MQGKAITFMAKWRYDLAGSSSHIHASLWDSAGAKPLFADPHARHGMSPLMQQFMAGQLAHAREITFFLAPFINSYRRFVEGSQAPVNLEWGLDNRTAGLRVPISGPAARRVENRIAGADANPYVVIAASLAAGLAGMEEGLTPSDPIEGNGYERGHDLARGFQAAHAQMLASKTSGRLLGDKFVAGYVSTKGLEYQHFLSEISAWERRYLVPQA